MLTKHCRRKLDIRIVPNTDQMNMARRVGVDVFAHSNTTALIALVGSNLFPLLGVLVFGWSIQGLLVVYWLESGIIGLLNIPKILSAHGAETSASRSQAAQLKSGGETVTLPDPPEIVPETPTWRRENWGVALFFTKHYGLFWLAHGVVIGIFPLIATGMEFVPRAALPTMAVGAGAVGVSHYVSYRQNYLGSGEWQTVPPGRRVNSPYSRVLLIHLTIIFGAFVVTIIDAPLGAVVVMIELKTALDIRGHLREHGHDSTTTPDPT